jgi:hypothetical protein
VVIAAWLLRIAAHYNSRCRNRRGAAVVDHENMNGSHIHVDA